MNRIEHKFNELRRENKKAFIVFITAGYPSLNITQKLILEFVRAGVDIIELGVPFSDPMADGTLIQESSQAALKKGVNLDKILNLVRDMRKRVSIPVCLMTYYNPVFCFGEERFVKKAAQYGVDGVIIPDLPPEEGKSFLRLAARFNLDTIFFLAPTSTRERIKFVSSVSKGFIYYVSLTGVTGPRQTLAPDLIKNLGRIKKYTRKPVCVGFGVSTPQQIRQIYKVSDGVIVGSAIIKKIKENLNEKNLPEIIAEFVACLRDV